MPTGVVKWFKTDKGFGFIKPDDGGPDIFVHITEVKASGMQDLEEGAKVAFEMKPSERTGRAGAARIHVID